MSVSGAMFVFYVSVGNTLLCGRSFVLIALFRCTMRARICGVGYVHRSRWRGAEALLYTKRYYQSPSGTCSLRAQGYKRQAFDDVRRLTTCISFRLSLLVRTSYMIRRTLSIPLHIYISETSECL